MHVTCEFQWTKMNFEDSFFFRAFGDKQQNKFFLAVVYILLFFHDCLLRVFMPFSIALCTHFLRYAYLLFSPEAVYKYETIASN